LDHEYLELLYAQQRLSKNTFYDIHDITISAFSKFSLMFYVEDFILEGFQLAHLRIQTFMDIFVFFFTGPVFVGCIPAPIDRV